MDDQIADLLGSLTLPGELVSAAPARKFVARVLDGRVDDLPGVELMTSELVTNVVHHAGSEVTVSVRAGPPVRVEVRDGLGASDAFRDLMESSGAMPDFSAIGGRGLPLVRLLANRVGVEDDALGGKVVWFEP